MSYELFENIIYHLPFTKQSNYNFYEYTFPEAIDMTIELR